MHPKFEVSHNISSHFDLKIKFPMIPGYNYLGYSHENVEGLGQDLRYWPKFWLLRGQNLLTHLYIYIYIYIYINDVQTTSTKKMKK